MREDMDNESTSKLSGIDKDTGHTKDVLGPLLILMPLALVAVVVLNYWWLRQARTQVSQNDEASTDLMLGSIVQVIEDWILINVNAVTVAAKALTYHSALQNSSNDTSLLDRFMVTFQCCIQQLTQVIFLQVGIASAYSSADTVQMGFESTGALVQTTRLPSISTVEKVTLRYTVNKYSTFLVPGTGGADDSITLLSADSSNAYRLSNYSLYQGERASNLPIRQNNRFGLRSEGWYGTGRSSNTTVGITYYDYASKTWNFPIVSSVTRPSGGMVLMQHCIS